MVFYLTITAIHFGPVWPIIIPWICLTKWSMDKVFTLWMIENEFIYVVLCLYIWLIKLTLFCRKLCNIVSRTMMCTEDLSSCGCRENAYGCLDNVSIGTLLWTWPLHFKFVLHMLLFVFIACLAYFFLFRITLSISPWFYVYYYFSFWLGFY